MPLAKQLAGLHPPSRSPTAREYSSTLTTFGPQSITARGLPFTNRFTRRADMFAVTAAEFTAEATANLLMNRFISLWGCPSTLLSYNGLQIYAQFATTVYKLLGVHKLTTSAYNPSGGGGVKRVNDTMAQMLPMVCNEHQTDWYAHLPKSNTPTINPLARRQVSLPMKYISDAYRAPCSPSSIASAVEPIRASTATISPTATFCNTAIARLRARA